MVCILWHTISLKDIFPPTKYRATRLYGSKIKNRREKSKMDSCPPHQVGASFAGMTEEIIED